jgi:hypothetical protein
MVGLGVSPDEKRLKGYSGLLTALDAHEVSEGNWRTANPPYEGVGIAHTILTGFIGPVDAERKHEGETEEKESKEQE